VNCCTLDWFDNWPEEALRTVSRQFFQANSMMSDNSELREAIADMFPQVHQGTHELSARFFEEQRRRVYITPKTFLDGLNLFKDQLDRKQQELTASLARLQDGIRKLGETNAQISQLQITLRELVPKLQEENRSAESQASQIKEQTGLA